MRRYNNAKTRQQYLGQLNALFASTGKTHPSLLTEADVIEWCGQGVSNNTIRNRLSMSCVFIRWCVRNGEADAALLTAITDRDNPLLHIPRLYGKAQSKNPARWLTYDEAFGKLLATCNDGTELGTRDEVVLRLGLAGMRLTEVLNLEYRNLRFREDPPLIQWLGKGRRQRQVAAGKQLVELLARYFAHYEKATGRPMQDDDIVVSRGKPGGGVALGLVSWGKRVKQPCTIQRIVKQRAEQAGLGHLTPHDLRRSAAGILHRATNEQGAHYFDLLDIQRVLGHANPATTMRSYLEPMDTNTIGRAAGFLD